MFRSCSISPLAASSAPTPHGAGEQSSLVNLSYPSPPSFLPFCAHSAGSCPAVVLLSLDLAPRVGLRSPSNFVGVAGPSLLRALRVGAEAAWLGPGAPPRRCSASSPAPPVVAFGHYPLSTVDAEAGAWPLGTLRRLARPLLQPTGLLAELLRLNVTAYLSGHLHGAFGQRLHAMHAGGGGAAGCERSSLGAVGMPCPIATCSTHQAAWRRVPRSVAGPRGRHQNPFADGQPHRRAQRPPGRAGNRGVEGRPQVPPAGRGRRAPVLPGLVLPCPRQPRAASQAGRGRPP